MVEKGARAKMDEAQYKELPANADLRARREYFEVGKGLQKVDGLETSAYLDEAIAQSVAGEYDAATAALKVSRYYDAVPDDAQENATKEADISAVRIAAILERNGFKFSPATLYANHAELFAGTFPDEWVGVPRTINITKDEPVLNGRSVQYADFAAISATLAYDFAQEKQARYALPFTPEQVAAFANFASNIWQTHPFREGNTRAVATFLLQYLRSLGVDVNNDPFKWHARFFRDALVRANYANIREGIYEDPSYLRMFFENVLMDAGHDLEALDLRCVPLFAGEDGEDGEGAGEAE